jgi:hypothetical protein
LNQSTATEASENRRGFPNPCIFHTYREFSRKPFVSHTYKAEK